MHGELIQQFAEAAFVQDAVYAALLLEQNAGTSQVSQQGGNGLTGCPKSLGQHLARELQVSTAAAIGTGGVFLRGRNKIAGKARGNIAQSKAIHNTERIFENTAQHSHNGHRKLRHGHV